jgi:phytoene dehydrogenase-like protein
MITGALLVALLTDLGGKIETGVRVTVFDLAPGAVAGILGDRLPTRPWCARHVRSQRSRRGTAVPATRNGSPSRPLAQPRASSRTPPRSPPRHGELAC